MSDWAGSEGEHWAAHADRYTRVLARFGALLVEAAGFAPGQRVIEIGCGNGDTAVAAGRAVGEEGSVLGVDLSEDMLGVARARVAAAGLTNTTFVAADATTFAPDPAGFDLAVSRFGVMFFDDPVAAFTNIRGLLAPGGRLVFACWQSLLVNDWLLVPAAAVAEVLPLPVPADPNAPGPFAFADAERVAGILSAAGFDGPAVEPIVAKVWVGDSPEEAADYLRTTGMGRAIFAEAPPELIDEALARAAAAVAPHAGPAGIELDGAAWLVTATT
ncbi:MAG: class I SAM-dependent methyltransferase [Acidimicrobiales bacterium]|nr:class I SAM-dependent methyltransferase [Acidimicrobiales bacterium]